MSLGFSVDALLPKARGGGQLRMGLVKMEERDWLQPRPDRAARAAGFAEWPVYVPPTSPCYARRCRPSSAAKVTARARPLMLTA